jgi:hypothetical protein
MRRLLAVSLALVVFTTSAFAGDSPDTIRLAYAMRTAVGDPSGSEVRSLLEAGFPPNHPIGCGTFVDAAFLSSEPASLSILKQFLAAGADVNSVRVYSPKPNMTWTATLRPPASPYR